MQAILMLKTLNKKDYLLSRIFYLTIRVLGISIYLELDLVLSFYPELLSVPGDS